MKKSNMKCILVLFFFFLCSVAQAVELSSPTHGFSIDLPSGCILEAKEEDGSAYQFSLDIGQVECVMKIYDKTSAEDTKDCLKNTLKKLEAKGDICLVERKARKDALSLFSMQKGQTLGAAACFFIDSTQKYLVVISYCPQPNFARYCNFIFSILDAVYITQDDYFSLGIVTAMAYQRQSPKEITVNIAGKQVKTQIDEIDVELETSIIEREFVLLNEYAKRSDWKEAWKRCYQMIFRSSFECLSSCGKDLREALYDGTSKTPNKDYAQKLLTFMQGLDYQRDTKTSSSDFASPTLVLQNKGSDCDSRVLLLSCLLQAAGIDSIMFISHEYDHAICGIYLKESTVQNNESEARDEKRFLANGREYTVAETTKKCNIGVIEDRINDSNKWIPILLP